MQLSSLKDSFLTYCEKNNYEKNIYQLKIIDLLIDFLNPNFPLKPTFEKGLKSMFNLIFQHSNGLAQ